jgi:hypothetical protein
MSETKFHTHTNQRHYIEEINNYISL